jgi:hypothetical protein
MTHETCYAGYKTNHNKEKNLIKVIVTMSVVSAGVLSLAFSAYERFMPVPIATAVISDKPEKVIGGQAATLLPTNLTERQAALLQMAHKFGKQEGFKNPEIVQSVLLQETHAGGLKSYKVANPGPEAYYGPMQIKLGAAKDVLKQNQGLFDKYKFHTQTDDEIKANLILNEEFNVEVATKYLRILRETYKLAGRELVNAYNRGPGGVKAVGNDFHYAVGAEEKLAAWKTAKK